MNDNAQRIAIAESCPGWQATHAGKYCSILNCTEPLLMNRGFDPLEDVTAMRVAIMLHAKESRTFIAKYLGALYGIVDTEGSHNFSTALSDDWKIHMATARQMAEAYLVAIGKWIDDESAQPIPRQHS